MSSFPNQILSKSSIARPVFLIALVLLLFLAAAWSRTLWEAHSALEAAAALEESGKRFHQLRRAVSWRSPLNPYAAEALEELEAIVFAGDESVQDRKAALEALSRGIMSSRSFLTVESDALLLQKLDRIEEELYRALQSEVEGTALSELRFGAMFFAQLSLWGWIGCVGYLLWFGVSKQGSIITRPFVGALFGWGFLFASWLYFLGRA